ncbi:MAG: cell division protein ZapE [Gammaproteobacteria bacterium]|nr:cell division protein ZapE [Gammaproteobacteria bacterium]
MEAEKAISHPRAPIQHYLAAVERGELLPDPAQVELVSRTQVLYEELTRDSSKRKSIFDGLRGIVREKNRAPVKGLYIWGGVGRGKTLLMNYFHDALPFEGKLRIHFHAFMHYIHGELKALGQRESPLALVADGLARDTRVICFDEFHVSDIADAMILGGLLANLFERGVTLVATSNIAPDDLYKDGLQRARFFPAIELIKKHTTILELDSILDYRLRALERVEIYHHPLDHQADAALFDAFEQLHPENVVDAPVIEIAGRDVAVVRSAEGIAWFDFAALCETPRSAADYIEIARRFHTVLVARVPRLDDERRDSALRFIHLIDALYERSVNLVISADAPPPALYMGQKLKQKFARAASRLEEMQTREYLAREHKP